MNKTIKKNIKKIIPKKMYDKMHTNKVKIQQRQKNNNKIKLFHNNFREIMFEAKICDSFDRTITPYNIKLINKNKADGISCELKFPKGLSINEIDKAKKMLSQNVYGKCMVFVDDQFGCPVKFSAIRKWHDFKYKPFLKLNASQLFLGYTIDLEPVIIDLSKYPHMLITGGTGGGKILLK